MSNSKHECFTFLLILSDVAPCVPRTRRWAKGPTSGCWWRISLRNWGPWVTWRRWSGPDKVWVVSHAHTHICTHTFTGTRMRWYTLAYTYTHVKGHTQLHILIHVYTVVWYALVNKHACIHRHRHSWTCANSCGGGCSRNSMCSPGWTSPVWWQHLT